MSKKKGFRTALATILVVLVIFAALTFAAIKYFLPMYQVSQSEVYSWAVKIYPLLIGITLIVIASMLGKSDKEDEGEEEDKLPPNSYDAQLFEEPKDDPATKPKKNAPVVPKVEEPETISDEAYAELISIFNTDEKEPEDEIKPFVAPEAEQVPEVKEEPVVEPLEEVEVQPEVEEPEEETEPEVESEVAEEAESESEPEAEATEEPEEAQPETEPEEVEEEQPEAETESEPEAEAEVEPVEEPAEALAITSEAPTSVEDPNKALVSAINALVEKMDDFTTAMIYGSEEDEEDEEEEYDEYEPEEEEPEETEEAVEEVEEEAPENDYEDHLSRIEQQISSLSDIIAKLADTLKNLPTQVVVAPTPVATSAEPEPEPVVAPEPVAEPEVEPEPAPVEEVEPETLEPEPASESVETEAEAEPESVDTTGSQIYKEYEGSPAKQTAMAEFDSAKDFGYDLTIAKVSAEQSAVALQLDDVQCIANGNNTLVFIPFADNAEAKEVLDKLGVPYEAKTMEAGSNMNFEDFAKDWIN